MLRPPERVRQQRDHSERVASGSENKKQTVKRGKGLRPRNNRKVKLIPELTFCCLFTHNKLLPVILNGKKNKNKAALKIKYRGKKSRTVEINNLLNVTG